MNAQQLPSDVDLERTLLGAAMWDPDALAVIAQELTADDFYSAENRAIFSTLVGMAESDQPIDALSLTRRLRDEGNLELAGGAASISDFYLGAPDITQIEYHSEELRRVTQRRQLRRIGDRLSLVDLTNPGDVIDDLLNELMDVTTRTVAVAEPLGVVAERVAQDVYRRSSGAKDAYWFGTGIEALDDKLVIRKGQMIVIAGLTATGKSALALQIAEHATRNGRRGVIFSLEMTPEELAERSLASETGIPVTRLNLAMISQVQLQNLMAASASMNEMNLLLDPAAGLTIMDIRARARRLQLRDRLDFIMIDYLQLIAPAARGRSRQEEVAEISRHCKTMAMTMGLPVFVLSQLNKDAVREKRPPSHHDMRESSAISHDANTVLITHRPTKEETQIIISKQRQGATGVCDVMFDRQRVRFR